MSVRLPFGPADLAEGEMRGAELDGGRLVLVARVGGALHAIEDVCNHEGCLLSEGHLRGAAVECPCHGMEFDVRTGAGVTEPPLCEDQRAYRVVERAGALFLEDAT
jgi:3-phenylpropionate/trans-cinnamate dioxygenase ferredoxin subunit